MENPRIQIVENMIMLSGGQVVWEEETRTKMLIFTNENSKWHPRHQLKRMVLQITYSIIIYGNKRDITY